MRFKSTKSIHIFQVRLQEAFVLLKVTWKIDIFVVVILFDQLFLFAAAVVVEVAVDIVVEVVAAVES